MKSCRYSLTTKKIKFQPWGGQNLKKIIFLSSAHGAVCNYFYSNGGIGKNQTMLIL